MCACVCCMSVSGVSVSVSLIVSESECELRHICKHIGFEIRKKHIGSVPRLGDVRDAPGAARESVGRPGAAMGGRGPFLEAPDPVLRDIYTLQPRTFCISSSERLCPSRQSLPSATISCRCPRTSGTPSGIPWCPCTHHRSTPHQHLWLSG